MTVQKKSRMRLYTYDNNILRRDRMTDVAKEISTRTQKDGLLQFYETVFVIYFVLVYYIIVSNYKWDCDEESLRDSGGKVIKTGSQRA